MKGQTMPGRRGGSDSGAEPRRRVEYVKKRDGRVVPFQKQKIADAVFKAMEAAGEPDLRFAAEVAGIVELTLVERAGTAGEPAPEIPHIETIQDLVERALMELGRATVAKAYILHRDLRARVRSALRVHRSDTLRAPVRVREREGVSSWSKGRIVAALMQEAELPREAAEDVASAVERRVFASGKKIVTTGVIRELVASELFERGWSSALTASRVLGLARHDVRRVLHGVALHPWLGLVDPGAERPAPSAPPEVLARELFSRFGLESVLSESASELHRTGDLHVVGLETLSAPLVLAVEAELLGGGGDPLRSAYALLDGLAELAPLAARGVVLERPAAVLAPLARTARENSPHGLTAWLRALVALAHGARRTIDLSTPGPRYHAFTARLVEELSELEGAFVPRLYLEGVELEALLEERPDLAAAVERLLVQERLVPTWSNADASFAGPGCQRRLNERGLLACSAAVALNLPRIARRVGPFREELFQGAVAELVQAAVEIARALRAGGGANARIGGMRARCSVALVPVGLREALLTLGDGAVDADLCARILGFLGEAARRFGREELVDPWPCPFFGAEPAARFAFLDARAAREGAGRQEWLFGEAEAALGETRPYSRGFQLSGTGAMVPGRAEAQALRTVPVGALELGALAAGGGERPALEAWRRFEVLRRAHAGELVLELFPRPRARSDAPEEREPTHLRPLGR